MRPFLSFSFFKSRTRQPGATGSTSSKYFGPSQALTRPRPRGIAFKVICNIRAAESLSLLRRACLHDEATSTKNSSVCLSKIGDSTCASGVFVEVAGDSVLALGAGVFVEVAGDTVLALGAGVFVEVAGDPVLALGAGVFVEVTGDSVLALNSNFLLDFAPAAIDAALRLVDMRCTTC